MVDRVAARRVATDADPVGTSSSAAPGAKGTRAASSTAKESTKQRSVPHEDAAALAAAAAISKAAKGKNIRPEVDAAALVSAEALQSGAQNFVSSYYEMYNKQLPKIYEFYDDDAVLVWTPHREEFTSSEVKTKKAIKKYIAEPLEPPTKCDPHCFVVQQVNDGVVLIVNGKCRGFGVESSNYVQSFVLRQSWVILSDVLLVFRDGRPIRVPKNMMPKSIVPLPSRVELIPGTSEVKDSNLMIRGRTKVSDQSRSYQTSKGSRKRTDGKSVAIVYDKRMMSHRPVFYCKNDDARMIQHEEPHPADEIPERISAIMHKLDAEKLMERVALVEPGFATMDQILAVHAADYVDFIRCLPPDATNVEKYFGYSTTDMFSSDGTRDAVFLAAGAAIKASEIVYTGEFKTAFAVVRPPGHHAGKSEAEGFCYVNNLAVAAKNLLQNHGAERIFGVDWDVHHGNGTQELFYSSNEVLFFSTFNNALTYPKTAKQSADHIGKGKGAGYNVNVPLRKYYGDADMLYIWNELLLPLLEEFSPDIIMVSCGFDGADGDVGGAKISAQCFPTLLDKMIKSGNGKVVLVLEGGYKLPVLANCAAHCVRLMTGDSEALLKEDKIRDPPKSTKDTVKYLKHQLSRYWEVFKE